MQINWIQGANYSSAPAWLPTVLNQVASFYDSLFTANITLNIRVNWVNLGQDVLASNNLNGSGDTQGVMTSFSTVSAALVAHETSTDQQQAYSHMASGVSSLYVSPAQAEMLGLMGGTSTQFDVDVGSNVDWTQFDAFGAIAHEITELAMGRFSIVGSGATIMDLFRYNGAGSHDLTAGNSFSNTTAYFSVDNGATSLGVWNNDANAGYDLGDWVVSGFPDTNDPEGDPIPNDAYGAQEGGVTPISEADVELMNVLGWQTRVLTYGDNYKVASGQSVSGYTVMNDATLTISSGGVASNTTYSDAQGFNDGVLMPGSSGGSSGIGLVAGLDSAPIIQGGGFEWVEAGGESLAATVSSAGVLYVDSGGLASGGVVKSGGVMDLIGGGQAAGMTVSSGATLNMVGVTVSSGASLTGGRITATTAEDGVTLQGGAYVGMSGMVVLTGGTINLLSGGVTNGAVLSGGIEYVEIGASETGTIIRFGHDAVYGKAVGTIVSGGGFENVESGGGASGAIVSAGGQLFVQVGGSASGITILSGGHDSVSGSITGTTVSGSGFEAVWAQGVSTSTTVLSGGVQYVVSGGESIATAIKTGGRQTVSSGGVASNTTLSGATEYLSGGVSVDTVISSGSIEYMIASGAASGTIVSSGGHDSVYPGGVAIGTTILSGGFEAVSSGGLASGSTVKNGGVQYILAGGVASGTQVQSGGRDSVAGVAQGVVLSSGGAETISAGGAAIGTQVSSGGHQYALSGGTASGSIIASGGILTVSSGGQILGGLTIGGGTAIVSGAAAAGQQVVFQGSGGLLDIANPSAFAAQIGGFVLGDEIELQTLAYQAGETVSWSQSGTSGTLTVTEGAQVAMLNLSGSYVTSNFTLSSGAGGVTIINDPPVPGGGQAVTLMAQHMAQHAPAGGAGGPASVHAWAHEADVSSALIPPRGGA